MVTPLVTSRGPSLFCQGVIQNWHAWRQITKTSTKPEFSRGEFGEGGMKKTFSPPCKIATFAPLRFGGLNMIYRLLNSTWTFYRFQGMPWSMDSMYFHRFTNLQDHPKPETKHILKLKKRKKKKVGLGWWALYIYKYIYIVFVSKNGINGDRRSSPASLNLCFCFNTAPQKRQGWINKQKLGETARDLHQTWCVIQKRAMIWKMIVATYESCDITICKSPNKHLSKLHMMLVWGLTAKRDFVHFVFRHAACHISYNLFTQGPTSMFKSNNRMNWIFNMDNKNNKQPHVTSTTYTNIYFVCTSRSYGEIIVNINIYRNR